MTEIAKNMFDQMVEAKKKAWPDLTKQAIKEGVLTKKDLAEIDNPTLFDVLAGVMMHKREKRKDKIMMVVKDPWILEKKDAIKRILDVDCITIEQFPDYLKEKDPQQYAAIMKKMKEEQDMKRYIG